jgi:hypothetical protein
VDHFGGRKSEDFQENPPSWISMFTCIIESSVQLIKGGMGESGGVEIKRYGGLEPLNIVRSWIRTRNCREPLDCEPKIIPLSYSDIIKRTESLF